MQLISFKLKLAGMNMATIAPKAGRIISPELEKLLLDLENMAQNHPHSPTKIALIFHLLRDIDRVVLDRIEQSARAIIDQGPNPEEGHAKVEASVGDRLDCRYKKSLGCQVKIPAERPLKFAYANEVFNLGLTSEVRRPIYGEGFHRYGHLESTGATANVSAEEIQERYENWKITILLPILEALEGDFINEIRAIEAISE